METLRKPLQGVTNIIRFNWHFYLLSFGFTIALLFLQNYVRDAFRIALIVLLFMVLAAILISLMASSYVYDFSDLYKLTWVDNLQTKGSKIVNVHAGFDETSALLHSKFSNSELVVLDFYDPLKHTEVSIRRARRAYPPYPQTQQVSTLHLPLADKSADKIFVILSAHEIRNEQERIIFFEELYRVLKPTGQIIVTEHLRDVINFLAYNIGFFHFYSKAAWKKTFSVSELNVTKEIRITPFITTFILSKHGTAP